MCHVWLPVCGDVVARGSYFCQSTSTVYTFHGLYLQRVSSHECVYVYVSVCPGAISCSLTHPANIETGFKALQAPQPQQPDSISILSVCQLVHSLHCDGDCSKLSTDRFTNRTLDLNQTHEHTTSRCMKHYRSSERKTLIPNRLSRTTSYCTQTPNCQ